MPVRPLLLPMIAGAVLMAGSAASAADPVVVQLKTAKGAAAGMAELREGPSGVLIRLDVKGLTPGWHGVHLHETGACSDEKFQSAGAHINHAPAKKPHGLLNPGGPDFGDLPNIHVGADGSARAEMFSALVSLEGAGGRAALKDANGSALLVHAGADDHTTQPIGGAGDRVLCGTVPGKG